MKIKISYYLCLAAVLTASGCRKFIDVSAPANSLAATNVYTSDATAISTLNGIYDQISQGGFSTGAPLSLSYFPALSADELSLFTNLNSTNAAYYTNHLNASTSGAGWEYWNTFYSYIFEANAAVAGLNQSSGLTPAIKTQLTGEAEFIRALCYFYLVNLYGDVPVVTGINYKVNSTLPRTAKNMVYQQIIADLNDAESKLSATYLSGNLLSSTPDRVRPTKWAAAALLSRAYLYDGNLTADQANFKNAVSQAALLTQGNALFTLNTLIDAFLDAGQGNNEAIWQLQPTAAGVNTVDAQAFVLPSSGPNDTYPVYVSPELLNAFEPNDQRKLVWLDSVQVSGTTYYYPYKYKVNAANQPVTESEMILRLGEQYLIKAEAEAELNDLPDAANDLNAIRQRAGLPNTSATTQSALLIAILHERQVELFTEMGHRWLDLKRTGTVNAVMGSPGNVCQKKGGTWNPDWALYPLPVTDLKTDNNLTQNPGY